jgi:hypothetical protein
MWISTGMSLLAFVGFAVNGANFLGFHGSYAFSLFFGASILALCGAGLKFMAVAGSVFALSRS